jgi:hypothetical protein
VPYAHTLAANICEEREREKERNRAVVPSRGGRNVYAWRKGGRGEGGTCCSPLVCLCVIKAGEGGEEGGRVSVVCVIINQDGKFYEKRNQKKK